MLIAILLTILPTIYFYLIFDRLIKSTLLKIAFSWFSGQYILAIATFLVSLLIGISPLHGVIQKGLVVSSLILIILVPFTYKQFFSLFKKIQFDTNFGINVILFIMIFLFSFFFYAPHLKLETGNIYISPVYWDFQWHAPLIQNFAFGDNLPPQNESFANIPSVYHFFWGFLVALYSTTGLDIVTSINVISIISMTMMLVAIVGIGEEIFKSKIIGTIAAVLTITSSSLHFLHYFIQVSGENIIQIIKQIITNTSHPFFFSFVSQNPFGYNGTMFNMFYFLAERQMVIGVIFLLFFVWLVYKRAKIPYIFLFLIGTVAAGYFLWHLFISVSVLCSLIFVFIFDTERKKSLTLLVSFGIIFFLFVLFYKNVSSSTWFFQDIASFPKINFNFPTMGNEYPLSLFNMVGYYLYAYGFKIILAIIGSAVLFRMNKKLFITFFSVIIPTFILTNSIQLSPLSIYDNHKWLRPMNVILDLLVAFAMYRILTYKRNALFFCLGILLLLSVTLSGFIEIFPFFNSKPTKLYAYYQSSFIESIRSETKPKSVFVGKHTSKLIQLAGRKLFLGDYSGQDLRLRKDVREKIINTLYSSNNVKQFCVLARENKIDFIEIDGSEAVANNKYFSYLSLIHDDKEVVFIDVEKSCQNYL